MPKVTLTYADETAIPTELKAFKTDDNKVEVWVNTNQEAVATELNPSLIANRDAILGEKNTFEAKYKALVSTSNKSDVDTAKEIADLKLKTANPIPEADQKILDAIKAAKADATPEFLSEAIKQYPIVNEKLTLLERNQANNQLFAASGFKNEKVFNKILNDPELNPNFDSVVWKDEKDSNGNAVKNPYVKVKTAVEGKVELPFADYAKSTSEWNDFLPALNGGTSQQQTQTWGGVQQSQQYKQSQQTNNQGGNTNKWLSALEQNDQAVATKAAEAAKAS